MDTVTIEIRAMTPTERRDELRLQLFVMLAGGLPAGWVNWDAETTHHFKNDVYEAQAAGTVKKLLPAAERLAGLYGVSMESIDPMHGQP